MSGRTTAGGAAVSRQVPAPRAAARPDAAGLPPDGSRTAPRTTPSRPELRLLPGVAPRVRRRSLAAAGGRAPFVLLVVALLVGTTLALLVLNTVIAVDSLKATALRADNAERAQEVQRLQQRVVTAGTPGEIARAAEAAGLVPAGPAAYLVLDPDGDATLRGTPEPAPPPEEPAAGQPPAEGGD